MMFTRKFLSRQRISRSMHSK
jgi:hypothetical protein